MVQLSLRVVLGALSAVTVAVVAAVTLSITLTSSVTALRRIGEKHADALLAIAEGETTQLFAKGSDTVLQIANVTGAGNRPQPSASPETVALFTGMLHTAFVRGLPEIVSMLLLTRDNAELAFRIDETDKSFYTFSRNLPDVSYNATVPVNQTFAMTDVRYASDTHAPFGTTTTVGPYSSHRDPSGGSSASRISGLWQLLFSATFNGFAPIISPLQAFYAADATGTPFIQELLPMGAPIYTADESFANGHEPYAFTLISFSAAGLNQFLRRTRSTPGTIAFAYDGIGFIFASSSDLPSRDLRPVSPSVPDGCVSTASYATNLNVEHQLVCRYSVDAFPHPGLKALASSDRATLFPRLNAGRNVRRVVASGDAYYAASVRVPLAFRGLEIYLLLLVPEADVLGDVITSRNVAIGVTCALVVLAVAANVAVTFVMLSPLGGIAARMLRAANLEDDGEDEAVSAMAEVAQLQEAYYAMNEELNRIRAYVPQSVLMARKAALAGDDDEDDEGDLEMDPSGALSPKLRLQRSNSYAGESGSEVSDSRSVRSVSSRRSQSTAKSPKAASSGGAAGLVAANVGIVTRQVSVVAANLVGLHGLAEPDVLLAEIAAAAEAMDDAVAARRGALTFHGDRFLATFNAAKACAGHAVKAASAAVAAASAYADRDGAKLQLTAGVASGGCTVGPVGSATVKALSAVGPAVTTAGLLERLASRGGHGAARAVLAAHRAASEAATSLVVEYVDLVCAPGTGRALAVASLTHPNKRSRRDSAPGLHGSAQSAADNDEWMYVMAKEGSPFNAVFEELHRGRVAAALKAFDELQQAAASCNTSMTEDGAAATADSPTKPGGVVAPPPRLVQVVDAVRASVGSEDEAEAVQRAARTLEFTHPI